MSDRTRELECVISDLKQQVRDAERVRDDLLRYLKEARRTLEMWKDVAPAVSLCADIDAAIARATGESK